MRRWRSRRRPWTAPTRSHPAPSVKCVGRCWEDPALLAAGSRRAALKETVENDDDDEQRASSGARSRNPVRLVVVVLERVGRVTAQREHICAAGDRISGKIDPASTNCTLFLRFSPPADGALMWVTVDSHKSEYVSACAVLVRLLRPFPACV